MTFRASRYIDFETGIVVTPPMALSQQLKRPLSVDDMRDLFECRVDVWQLGPAVAILKKIECHRFDQSSTWAHAAYVLLGATFTYFEMLGKTLNPKSRPSGTAGDDFNYGFCDVYPSFRPASGSDPSDLAVPDVKEFRNRVRNGLYHLGYTKGNLFIWDEPSRPDFFIDKQPTDPIYYVNPHAATRTIVDHFPGFIARLRPSAPGSTELRARFKRFFEEYHVCLRGPEST